MNCGASDLICYVLALLASYGVELTSLLKWLPWFEERVRENLQGLIGLAGFSFGVWKWWYFRERTLHKRLREYLNLQDERLVQASTYILEALHRPGAERTFAEPLFAVRALRRVLKRRKWTSILTIGTIETGADHLLDKALRKLQSRVEAGNRQLAALQHQRARAHELKGVIASARASAQREARTRTELDYRALDSFRAALQIAGHAQDLRLREYEAHQLTRLGYLNEACAQYEALEARLLGARTRPEDGIVEAPLDSASREDSLFLAQVRASRAKIIQAQVIAGGGRGAARAYALLTSGAGAIDLRAPYAPFQGWDSLEQADLHYLTAFVCRNLGFNVQEAAHLGRAETEYRRITSAAPAARWFGIADRQRLRAAASAGLERVKRARGATANEPRYDEDWLLPPLQVLQRPTSKISDGAGEQAVAQASKQDRVDDARIT